MNKKPQDELLRTWREGMNALAQLPQTFAKISQLGFIQDNWEKKGSLEESRVKSLVKEVIDMFTPERCMYASNYPVDKATNYHDMYQRFLAWNEEWDLDDVAKDCLFYSTAVKAYRL